MDEEMKRKLEELIQQAIQRNDLLRAQFILTLFGFAIIALFIVIGIVRLSTG